MCTSATIKQIMYLRYGRALLDSQLEEVFGTSDLNSGKLLTLTEFLHCLHASQVRQDRSLEGSVMASGVPDIKERVGNAIQCVIAA